LIYFMRIENFIIGDLIIITKTFTIKIKLIMSISYLIGVAIRVRESSSCRVEP